MRSYIMALLVVVMLTMNCVLYSETSFRMWYSSIDTGYDDRAASCSFRNGMIAIAEQLYNYSNGRYGAFIALLDPRWGVVNASLALFTSTMFIPTAIALTNDNTVVVGGTCYSDGVILRLNAFNSSVLQGYVLQGIGRINDIIVVNSSVILSSAYGYVTRIDLDTGDVMWSYAVLNGEEVHLAYAPPNDLYVVARVSHPNASEGYAVLVADLDPDNGFVKKFVVMDVGGSNHVVDATYCSNRLALLVRNDSVYVIVVVNAETMLPLRASLLRLVSGSIELSSVACSASGLVVLGSIELGGSDRGFVANLSVADLSVIRAVSIVFGLENYISDGVSDNVKVCLCGSAIKDLLSDSDLIVAVITPYFQGTLKGDLWVRFEPAQISTKSWRVSVLEMSGSPFAYVVPNVSVVNLSSIELVSIRPLQTMSSEDVTLTISTITKTVTVMRTATKTLTSTVTITSTVPSYITVTSVVSGGTVTKTRTCTITNAITITKTYVETSRIVSVRTHTVYITTTKERTFLATFTKTTTRNLIIFTPKVTTSATTITVTKYSTVTVERMFSLQNVLMLGIFLALGIVAGLTLRRK